MSTVADWIEAEREAIVRGFAREAGRAESARGLSRPLVIDSLPAYLDALAACLRSGASAEDGVVSARAETETNHVFQRIRLGFAPGEVEDEYRLVLRLIVATWEGAAPDARPDGPDVDRLRELLEAARRRVATEFAGYTVEERQREKRYLRRLDAAAPAAVEGGGEATGDANGRRFEPLLAVVAEAMEGDGCALFLAGEGGSEPALAAAVGPFGGLAVADRELASVTRSAAPLSLEVAATAGAPRSLLGARVPPEGALEGVLVVATPRPDVGAARRRFLELLAERLAGILGRARYAWDARRATQALRAREREFRLLAEAMPQQVWTARPDGNLDYVNRQLAAYFGRSPDALVGTRWLELVHPDDLDRVREAWGRAVGTGTIYEVEQRLRRADGAYRWHLTRAFPERDEPGGRPLRWLGTSTDVDALKRAEETLRRSNEFGQQLLGVVSHDLKNPLNAVVLGTQLLLRSGGLPEAQARTATRILVAAERAVRLVGDLLDFTRARLGEGIPIERRPLDFDDAVGRVVDELRLLNPDRTIEFAPGAGGPGSWDPDRLAQVVTNLVNNALAYGPRGAPVDVVTRDAGDRVELAVHNGGDPIPPELLPRLFEPMLRGTARGGGLGLGLFIVDRIVRGHGGTVDVRSVAGEGTTFRIFLPRDGPNAG